MSLVELKKEAAALSPTERIELAMFLADLDASKEDEFRQTVDRRMKAIDLGKKVGAADFEAAHIRQDKRG